MFRKVIVISKIRIHTNICINIKRHFPRKHLLKGEAGGLLDVLTSANITHVKQLDEKSKMHHFNYM